MIDIGTLTSMKQLPVMQLNYGGAFTSMSSIEFDLGPMRCTGIWIHLKIVKSRCRNLSHPKQLKSYKGKSKPFPSELAQIERLNIKKQMATNAKIVKELQNKVSKTTNDLSISRYNFETKLNSKFSARVDLAFFASLYKN